MQRYIKEGCLKGANLGGLDADVLIELGVSQGQLDSLLDLLHLLLQPAHVCIGLQGSLLNLQRQN